MLTSARYTLMPSFIEKQKAVKNSVELQGFRNAYARDGAAMVRPVSSTFVEVVLTAMNAGSLVRLAR